MDSESKPLARVYDSYLYFEDVSSLDFSLLSPKDSIALLREVSERWVREQLFVHEALEEKIDLEAIEKRVEEFRNQLIVHEYQKKWLIKNVDTSVSEKEIEMFYNESKANFVLPRNIVKALFIKTSKKNPKNRQLESLLLTASTKSIKQIETICIQFAESYHLNDTTWVPFENLVHDSPFNKIDDPINFIQNTKLSIREDEQYVYLLRILEHRTTHQTAPLDYYKPRIQAYLKNRKTQTFQKNHESELFEKALHDKDIEVFL